MDAASPPRRVVLCGCDGFFSALVLRRLLRSPGLEVVAVVRSTRVLRPRYGFIQGAWEQIRHSGLAYSTYLWVTTTWTELVCPCSLRRLTRARRIPVLATRNINDPAGLAFVAAARPDLLVCAFFNQRLGAAVLALPRQAGLNIHPSWLPDFKGVDPVFFARLRASSRFGVTVHHLSLDLDGGDILFQDQLPVPAQESLFRTTARLFDLGGRVLAAQLMRPGRVPPGTPQAAPGHYDSWPSARAVGRLRARGVALMRLPDLVWAWRALL